MNTEEILKSETVKYWTRLAAFLIDLLVMYGITYSIVTIASIIPYYLPPLKLFIFIAIPYSTIFIFIMGSTPGKIIAKIKIVSFTNNDPTIISILIRELFGKIIIGFLPPLVLSSLLFPNYWFYYLWTVLIYQLILFIYILFRKSTLYDSIAKTKIIRIEKKDSKIFKTVSFVFIITSFVILTRVSNYGNMNNFIPKHSEAALTPYVKFIDDNKTNPKDYILNLFDKYDLVVLCERFHPEMTQWDLIYQIVSDSIFTNKVGNIFTEYGAINLQEKLDQLMEDPNLSEDEVEENIIYIMRNLGIWGSWSNTNFYLYLKKLYTYNKRLPISKKIHHYFADVPIDWNDMTPDKYNIFRKRYLNNRDHEMALNIINGFNKIKKSDSKRKKALVIMNYRHAFKFNKGEENTAAFLFKEYPSTTANVLLNTVIFDWNFINRRPIQNGIWDEAFEKKGNINIGFNFEQSPFGDDAFDLFPKSRWKKLKYKDVFTGFVFYKPLNEHFIQTGIPNMYDDFLDEEMRRDKCIDVNDSKSYDDAKAVYINNSFKKGMEYYSIVDSLFNLIILLTVLVLGLPTFTYLSIKNYKNDN
ncbi:MAG: RDD family protein [Bacteroidetes bacterium]|nr:RDD family protein [Bacteroidota bacterium]